MRVLPDVRGHAGAFHHQRLDGYNLFLPAQRIGRAIDRFHSGGLAECNPRRRRHRQNN